MNPSHPPPPQSDPQNDGWQIAFVKLSAEKDSSGCKSVKAIRLEQDFTLLDLIKVRKLVFEQSLWNVPKTQSALDKPFESRARSTSAKRATQAMSVLPQPPPPPSNTSKKRRRRPTQEQCQQDKIVFFKSKDPRKNPEIGLIVARYMIRCSKRRTLPSVVKQREEIQKKRHRSTSASKAQQHQQYTRKWILHPDAAEQFTKIDFANYDQVDGMIKNAILSGSAQDLNVKPIEKQLADAMTNSTTNNTQHHHASTKSKSTRTSSATSLDSDSDDDDDNFVVNDNCDMAAYETNIRRAQQDQRITYPAPQNMTVHLDQSIAKPPPPPLSTTSTNKRSHTSTIGDGGNYARKKHTTKQHHTSTNTIALARDNDSYDDDDDIFAPSLSSSSTLLSSSSSESSLDIDDDDDDTFAMISPTKHVVTAAAVLIAPLVTVAAVTKNKSRKKRKPNPTPSVSQQPSSSSSSKKIKPISDTIATESIQPSATTATTTPPIISTIEDTMPEAQLTIQPRKNKSSSLGPRSLFSQKPQSSRRDENSSSEDDDDNASRNSTMDYSGGGVDNAMIEDEVILNLLPDLDKYNAMPLVLSQPHLIHNTINTPSSLNNTQSMRTPRFDVSRLDDALF